MTWWIAFIIAVLGWYFTATQNSKSSARALINQEIKEARTKMQEIIVSSSYDNDGKFPLDSMTEEFIKMQTYINSVQELNHLYVSYNSSRLRNIKVIRIPLSVITQVSFYKDTIGFIADWFLPENNRSISDFDLSRHVFEIRQALTSDEVSDDESRLATLNFEYGQLCRAYQFVG